MLQAILRGEEEHADWLEAQIGLMAQLGEANYRPSSYGPDCAGAGGGRPRARPWRWAHESRTSSRQALY